MIKAVVDRKIYGSLQRRKVERCIYQSKNEANEQFGRKVNQDMSRNRKLFWKEESCSRIKNGAGRLTLGKDKIREIWKDYFEFLYSINIQEQAAVHICGFAGVSRGNYFRGELK